MSWKNRYAPWLVCPREGCTEPERIEAREPIPGGTRYHCACQCGGRWAVVVLGEREVRADLMVAILAALADHGPSHPSAYAAYTAYMDRALKK